MAAALAWTPPPKHTHMTAAAQALNSSLYELLYSRHGYHSDITMSHAGHVVRLIVGPLRRHVDTVLDVGCSHGLAVARLWKHGIKASGTDLSPTAVAMARRRLRRPSNCAGPCFTVGSATALPHASKSVDAIMTTDVLEHLSPSDVPVAFRELRRVARRLVLAKIALEVEHDQAPVAALRRDGLSVTALHTTVWPLPRWLELFYSHGMTPLETHLVPGSVTIVLSIDGWLPGPPLLSATADDIFVVASDCTQPVVRLPRRRLPHRARRNRRAAAVLLNDGGNMSRVLSLVHSGEIDVLWWFSRLNPFESTRDGKPHFNGLDELREALQHARGSSSPAWAPARVFLASNGGYKAEGSDKVIDDFEYVSAAAERVGNALGLPVTLVSERMERQRANLSNAAQCLSTGALALLYLLQHETEALLHTVDFTRRHGTGTYEGTPLHNYSSEFRALEQMYPTRLVSTSARRPRSGGWARRPDGLRPRDEEGADGPASPQTALELGPSQTLG